jgi:predicted ATP-binding protein involved in virulence
MKRIKQISVKNLFGMFDHTISLNMDERITIIHGPNGFGKTAILRLLNSLFSSDNSALEGIPFDEVRVQFEDNTDIWVNKAVEMSEISEEYRNNFDEPPPYFIFHFFDPAQEKTITHPLIKSRWSANAFDPHRFTTTSNRNLYIATENNFNELRKSVPLHFIETQRLQNTRIIRTGESFEDYEEEAVIEPTVITYSQELVQIITAKLAESTKLSQTLDRSFPTRVVNPIIKKRKVKEEELRNKLEQLEQKRQYLSSVGLLDQEGADSIQVQEQDQIDESTKVVLSVYAEDTEKKLGIFDELANKIDLLKRIINKRFLYKEMTISKERGFIFTNAKGVVLSPDDLSSGEQHELILFYELLFKVAPGSLILIDEPEISLHVVWQEQFLEDVLAVTRLSDIDVLLATHSPDIVGGRRDLMVELKGPE